MKAKLSIIITAACFIAGCSSEKTIDIDKGTPDENGMVYMEFSSGAPIVENNSRTQLGDNFSVLWSDGDNISVFSNEGVSYKFTENNISGPSSSAVFGGMITEGVGQTFALYPYNATAKDSTGKKTEYINTYIPASQTIPAGGYDPKACVSVAQLNLGSSYPSGEFKLACGLVGFRLINPKFDNEEKKVKAIRIRVADTDAENHPHLAGNARINVSSPTAPKVEYGLNNSHSILLESTTGHFEDNQNYYICLPELNGVHVTFTFLLDDSTFCSNDVKLTAKRALVYSFEKTLILTPEDFEGNNAVSKINDEQDFIKWYNNLPASMYGTVNINADLDFSNLQDVLVAHDFYGTFNGNNHTIKGLKMQPSTDGMVGLFANLNAATVSDVTIDKMQVVGSGTPQYAGGIAAYMRSSTRVTGCNVINTELSAAASCGGIAGKADRSVVDGCTSKTNKLNSENTGALVGELGGSNTVEASYSVGTQLGGSNTGAVSGYLTAVGNNIVSCYSDAECNGSISKTIVGSYSSNMWKNTHVSETYYIGSSNVDIGHNLGAKITSGELVNNKDAMNSALETSGSNYRFTEGTGDEPLILTKK